MRILLLNQFFHPDLSAVAQLAADLAEDLVAGGHEVTALAARGTYLGHERLPRSGEWRGVRIIRVTATSFGKRSLVGRLVDYASFYGAAALRALSLPRYDLVVATTAPPLVASIGALLRAVKGTRFVYWMQDVYPELAVEFGVIGARSLPVRGFELLARATLRRADAVVVLGSAMGQRVRAKGVEPQRVHILPNWADAEGVRPIVPEANVFRREHGLEGKTVVLYSGNMGRGHDMRTLLEAARVLRDRSDLVFAFIGDGAKRAEVEAAGRDLPSIRLFPYQPRERLAESLSAGDLHVVTQDACTLGLIEPSKLYGVLAAGRPVLFIGPAESEAAATVLREGVGSVVANGDIAGTVRAIIELSPRSAELGARARSALERTYSRAHRTAAFSAILREVTQR
jgi:glycosyltransferase involved in cell wall biosynthesis